jgi:hypothetical protein
MLSSLVDETKTEEGALFEEVCGAGDEPSDIFANECKGSSGELEFEPLAGTFSGITKDMETGRFEGKCANVAVVGEKAAAAERFKPDLGDASAFAGLLLTG